MLQQSRVLLGARHYHFPRIDYNIPRIPDYLRDWGGRSPSFNLIGKKPSLLPSLLAAWRRSLRREGVPKLALDRKQQTIVVLFLSASGFLWRLYPLGFFLFTVLCGTFSIVYKDLAACERWDSRWKNYRLTTYYSRFAFWLLLAMSLFYLHITA